MLAEDFSRLQREIIKTQVVIFAGGMGKRMGVDHPKALLQVDGRTLLDRCLELYSDVGFTNFILLLGHGHRDIQRHMESRKADDLSFTYSVDPETGMGRARSFKHALRRGAVDSMHRAMVVYPDDLFTDAGLPRQILSEHIEAVRSLGVWGSVVLTKGLKWPYGVADVEQSGLVTQFVEKPPVYYPTSVGSYVFEPEVYDLVLREGHEGKLELEQTLIPQLSRARKLYGLFIPSDCWFPVNTPKDFEEAEKALTNIHLQKRTSFKESAAPSLTR